MTDHSANSPIEGVFVRELKPNRDHRGELVEVYREQWGDGWRAFQFNAVFSEPNVLRGVHVHASHYDYVVLIEGRMLLGLHDMRPNLPTARRSSLTEHAGRARCGVVIPPGVAHGFFFMEPSLVLYGLARAWDRSDEFLCRWNAEELGLQWPTREPILIERDVTAPDYASCCAEFEKVWLPLQAATSTARPV